jgi:hypothetical protein
MSALTDSRGAPFTSEDAAGSLLKEWLEGSGWEVAAARGHSHGADIEAHRDGVRWLIEVRGQGKTSVMRINFFLGALGELLRHMDDPQARYSIAVPDLPQFRRLWERLPSVAAEPRSRISALFVGRFGHVEEVLLSQDALLGQ